MINQQLSDAYKTACEIELRAFKPGNVSIYSDGHDMTVEDFRVSAEVSAFAITHRGYSLGEKIFYAVKATREAVGCNTNLGIVLLCAPLLQAAMARKTGQSLRDALGDVLSNTTLEDANWTFKAITLASPGGLGNADNEDVNQPPSVTLTEAMQFASDRDRIALQYTTDYKDIFEFSLFRYTRALVLSDDSDWAAASVFAALLAQYPDSHIERKYGKQYSEWIRAEMALLDEAMQSAQSPDQLFPRLYSLDKAMKAKKINPGTTADMTVATVLVEILERLIASQRQLVI